MRPIVDRNKCNGCGECVDFGCLCATFKLKQGQARVSVHKECIGCEFCVDNCPLYAIKLSKKKLNKKRK